MNWQINFLKTFDCKFLGVDSSKSTSESLLTGILKRANLLEINFLYTPVKFNVGGSMLRFNVAVFLWFSVDS